MSPSSEEKRCNLLDEVERFWQSIDDAKTKAGGASARQCEILIDRLSAIEAANILLWNQILDGYALIAHKNKLWGAAYLMNGGASDDGFMYFKGWLIAQGKTVFANALADPDSLAEIAARTDETVFELEEMFSVGCNSYFRRQGIVDMSGDDYRAFYQKVGDLPLPEELPCSQFESIGYTEAMHGDIDAGWDEETLKAAFPRLYEMFLGG